MDNNKKDIESIMQDILSRISSPHTIKVEDIPNIDLYMDQVTTFMEDHLGSTLSSAEDKVLTKTMINNYAKNKLLPPPVKKKYNREHMLLLIFIYYFKGILSLQDIQSLLKPLLETYYENQSGLDVTAIYRSCLTSCEGEIANTKDDVSRIWNIARENASGFDAEDADFMQIFTAINILTIDVLMKKSIIEQLIDSVSDKSPKK